MEHVKRVKPAIVVIDSFRVFDDLAPSKEDLRKFGYELTVQLMVWEATIFLLGEFGAHDIETNPLFSIVDGLVTMSQREQSGEQQRFLQIVKMRGTAHSPAEAGRTASRRGRSPRAAEAGRCRSRRACGRRGGAGRTSTRAWRVP